jgi:HlyD family secretion protein
VDRPADCLFDQVGQSMNRGERLGQIDSAGRNKLVARSPNSISAGSGRPARAAEWGGKSYR